MPKGTRKRIAVIENAEKGPDYNQQLADCREQLKAQLAALKELFSCPFFTSLEAFEKEDIELSYYLRKLRQVSEQASALKIATLSQVKEIKKTRVINYQLPCITVYKKAYQNMEKLYLSASLYLDRANSRRAIINPITSTQQELETIAHRYYLQFKQELNNYLSTIEQFPIAAQEQEVFRKFLEDDFHSFLEQLQLRLPQSKATSDLSNFVTAQTGVAINSPMQRMLSVFKSRAKAMDIEELVDSVLPISVLDECSSTKQLKEIIAVFAHLQRALNLGTWKAIKNYSLLTKLIAEDDEHLSVLHMQFNELIKQQSALCNIRFRIANTGYYYQQDITKVEEFSEILAQYQQKFKRKLNAIAMEKEAYSNEPLLQCHKESLLIRKTILKKSQLQLSELSKVQQATLAEMKADYAALHQQLADFEPAVSRINNLVNDTLRQHAQSIEAKTKHTLKMLEHFSSTLDFTQQKLSIENRQQRLNELISSKATLGNVKAECDEYDFYLYEYLCRTKEKITAHYNPQVTSLENKLINNQLKLSDNNPFAKDLAAAKTSQQQTHKAMGDHYRHLHHTKTQDLIHWHENFKVKFVSFKKAIDQHTSIYFKAQRAQTRIGSDCVNTANQLQDTVAQEFQRIFKKYYDSTKHELSDELSADTLILQVNMPQAQKIMDATDKRLMTLACIHQEIKINSNDYINLHVDQKKYERQLKHIIVEHMHHHNSEALSDGKRNKFVQWLRKNLLKPISKLKYNAFTKSKSPYSLPITLFATTTEKSLAKAANNALKDLDNSPTPAI